MRKYSKILGTLSMSFALLLGFVEASHAQGSRVTAIDILLQPDATMVQACAGIWKCRFVAQAALTARTSGTPIDSDTAH